MGGGSLTLLTDATYTGNAMLDSLSGLTIKKENVTIDLNGKTLSINSGKGYDMLYVNSVSNFVLKNGTVTMDKLYNGGYGVIYIKKAQNCLLQNLTVRVNEHEEITNYYANAIYSTRSTLTVDHCTIDGAVMTLGSTDSLLFIKNQSVLNGALSASTGTCVLVDSTFAGGRSPENATERNYGVKSGNGLLAINCTLTGDLELYDDATTRLYFIGGTIEADIYLSDATNSLGVCFNCEDVAKLATYKAYKNLGLDFSNVTEQTTTFVGERKIVQATWDGNHRGKANDFCLNNCNIETSLFVSEEVGTPTITGTTDASKVNVATQYE